MSQNVIFEGTIEQVATRVDNSIKITLGSQELPPEAMLKVFEFKGVHAHILISGTKVHPKQESLLDGVKTSTEPTKGKSPSQRYRSALYVYWEQQGSTGEFNDFYNERMEKLINNIKDKLE